jgi:serine/threonine protein kinase/WD40 repeat protein/DNA-binding winged helix-turn-helix (wHTH) protein
MEQDEWDRPAEQAVDASGEDAVVVRVFGGMAVHHGDEPVSIGRGKQRRLLALLAIRTGSVVSVDWLAEYLWADDDRPAAPIPAIRTYLSRMRQRLPESARDWIQTEGGGYRFEAPPVQVEHLRFSILRERARQARDAQDPGTARAQLAEALMLWRGEPFRELEDLDWAIPEIERLRADHLEVIEERWEADLALGRHTQITGELAAFTAEHGLRDRAARQHALALHRSGRTAEALRVLDGHRRQLVDETGLDPSPAISELEQALLAGDRSLDVETVGRPLRGYRLIDEVGSGAFAVVWRGVQPSVNREVAIKQIRAELASRPDFIRRFEAEAHLIARIEHPHIVPLIDFWRDPDSAYLVMRWLSGGTLERRLDDGPLSVAETLILAQQMCGALGAAHRHGIIHCDVKAGNILFDETNNAFLTDFGIALEAKVSGDAGASISTGSPAYSAPEQLRREHLGPEADVFSLGVVLFECLTGSLPFHRSGSVRELIEQQLNTDYPTLMELRADVPAWLSKAVAKATAKNPADRYSSAADFAKALAEPDSSPWSDSGDAASAPVENPYKGLRAFDVGDSADFFGREGLVNQFIDRLSGTSLPARCLVVVGPSGSGKSSVVRAGLLPALQAGAVPGSQHWFTTTMVPGATPFEALEAALLRVSVNPPDSLLTQLEDGKRGILRGIRRCLASDDDTVLLVVDQFEELFTNSTDAEAHRFLDALAVAVMDPASPLRIIVTLRADYYDRPLGHPAFAWILDDTAVNLKPLAPDELEAAMVEPARRVGVDFEPGLITRIAADTVGQPAPLPLLQFALSELFDRRVGDQLTIDAYDQFGGVTGALAAGAEGIFSTATGPQRAAIRSVFGRLVNPVADSSDLRRRVRLSDFGDDPASTWVLDAFGAARLLSFDRDPTTREPTVEVAHEALLRAWPRLVAWLDEDVDLLRGAHAVSAAARAWDDSGREVSDLYRGGRLLNAAELASVAPGLLSAADLEYVEASRAAEEEERRAEARRVARLRRMVMGIGAALVLALLAGGLAVREQRRTEQQRQAAVVATESAELATLISRSAAATDDDPTVAILLALEAHRRAPGAPTEQALVNALGSSGIPNRVAAWPELTVPAPGCEAADFVTASSVNSDGTQEFGVVEGELVSRDLMTGTITEHGPAPEPCVFWLADESKNRRWAGSYDGLRMWFAPYDGPWGEPMSFGVPTSIRSSSFTPTGNLVAYSYSVGTAFLTLLDDQTGEQTGTSFAAGSLTGRITVSPDGKHVAIGVATAGSGAATSAETVILDGQTGEEVFRLPDDSTSIPSTHTFDVVTQELLVGYEDGAIVTVDLASGEVLARVESSATAGFSSLDVGSDGLVVALSPSQIELVDRRSGPIGAASDVRDASTAIVGPDDLIVVVASDGGVEILDLDGNALIEQLIDVDPLAAVAIGDGRIATVRNPGGTPTVIDLSTQVQAALNLVSSDGDPYAPIGLWPAPDGVWALDADDTLTRWRGDQQVERLDLPGSTLSWKEAFGAFASLTASAFDGQSALLYSLDDNDPGLVLKIPNQDAIAVHPSRSGGMHIVTKDATVRTYDSDGNEMGSVSIAVDGWSTSELGFITQNNFIAVDATTGRLAVGSDSGVVLVDPLTGDVVELAGTSDATNLQFVRQGDFLAITSRDGAVRLWDPNSGFSVGTVWNGSGLGGAGSWYDDETESLWVNTSGAVVQVPLDPAMWVQRACRAVGRDLTQAEWEQFVTGEGPPQSACR